MSSSRAPSDEYARRVNQAMARLEEGFSAAAVAKELAREHGVSVRQGWRYVRQATQRSEPLEIPEPKVVFTVKLPEPLVERIRALAASRGQTLSALVSQALEELLRRFGTQRSGGGQEN